MSKERQHIDGHQAYRVQGRAISGGKAPLPRLSVRVVNRRLRSETELGRAHSDKEGAYDIALDFAQVEAGPALNLQVRIYDALDTLVAESPIEFDAPPITHIDVIVPDDAAALASEYDRMRTMILPALEGADPASLTDCDLTFLAEQTGVARSRLARFWSSMVVSRETDLPQDALYAWTAQGLPADVEGLFREDPDRLEKTLRTAAREGLVAPGLADAAASVTGRLVHLASRREHERGERRAFTGRLRHEHTGEPIPDLEVEGLLADGGCLQGLGRIRTDGNGEFVLFPPMAKHSTDGDGLEVVLRVTQPDGTAVAERREAIDLADELPRDIRIVPGYAPHPLDEIRIEALLQRADPQTTRGLIDALGARQIETIGDLRRAGGAAALREAVEPDALATLARHVVLVLIAPDTITANTLVALGYDSPVVIARSRQSEFLRSAAGMLDEQVAARVHGTARVLDYIANDLLAEVSTSPGNQAARTMFRAAVVKRFPFRCEDGKARCDDCESAFSRGAYLADLFEYVSERVKSRWVLLPGSASSFEPVDLRELHQPVGGLLVGCGHDESVRQVRICIEVLRSFLGGPPSPNADARDALEEAERRYLSNAYTHLLRQAGTTYDELRLTVAGDDEAKATLAQRLGLSAGPAASDVLSQLRLDPLAAVGDAEAITEERLEVLFGLQDTSRDPLSSVPVVGAGADQVERCVLTGVAWRRNTASDGRIFLRLATLPDQSVLVELYKNEARTELVASGQQASGQGAIPLVPMHGSGLGGMLIVRFSAPTSEIELPAIPKLLAWRLERLHSAWAQVDRSDDPITPPILDPDIVRSESIRVTRPDHPVIRLWHDRRQWLEDRRNELVRSRQAAATAGRPELDAVLAHGASTSASHLTSLVAREKHGESIESELKTLGLGRREFLLLAGLAELEVAGEVIADDDWQSALAALVQVMKRAEAPAWKTQEAAEDVVLAPDLFDATQPVPGAGGDARTRWRVDRGASRYWHKTLEARTEQARVLERANRLAIDVVEEATLPALRNALIEMIDTDGDTLEEQAHWLGRRLLIDTADSGCRKTTRVEQAIETLARLVADVRSKSLMLPIGGAREFWIDDPEFGDTWRWLGSYGDWKAARRAYFYPENWLFPTARVSPPPSDEFNRLTDQFRVDRITPARAIEEAEKYKKNQCRRLGCDGFELSGFSSLRVPPLGRDDLQFRAILSKRDYDWPGSNEDRRAFYEELYFHVPIYMGLRLQEEGYYQDALDWFRLVYDFDFSMSDQTNGSASKVYYPLVVEERPHSRLDHDVTDIAPGDPHRVARRRANAYTRFTVQVITQCLLDYADDEYTRDTVTSVALARGLYDKALRLIDRAGMRWSPDVCGGMSGAPDDPVCANAWTDIVASANAVPYADDRERLLRRLQTLLASGLECGELIQQAQHMQRAALAEYPLLTVHDAISRREEASADLQSDALFDLLGSDVIAGFAPREWESDVIPAGTMKGLLPDLASVYRVSEVFCVPPNPMLEQLRMHAAANREKIRRCRNIAGMERPLKLGDEARALPRPAQYRFQFLLDRARYLVGVAKQTEAAYLSAIQRSGDEQYRLQQAGHDVELSKAAVDLQAMRIDEAQVGVTLGGVQEERAEIQADTYAEWVERGKNHWEREMLEAYSDAAAATFVATGLRFPTNPMDAFLDLIRKPAEASAVVAESRARRASAEASFERREDQWRLQQAVAEQDQQAAAARTEAARRHLDVVRQEEAIAGIRAEQAEETVAFLLNKFDNVLLYERLVEILQRVFRYFLTQATAVAKTAQGQLAFERQQQLPSFIQGNYWHVADDRQGRDDDEMPELRGLTGSARLLEDVTRLEQYRIETERRKLQVKRTISFAELDPFAFEEFRRTGVLPMLAPQELFDRDYPGHYLRLIRRVRVSLVALIPPTTGIRATLSSSGTSTVVVPEGGFQTLPVHTDPESVALSAPMDSTGLFEFSLQSQMPNPFEGHGVDLRWDLELPKASNPFDYHTIADVLLTMDYTALSSLIHRQAVRRRLGRRLSAQRAFSFRQELADAWYDLHNPDLTATPMSVRFEIRRGDFPPNLDALAVEQVVLYFVLADDVSAEEFDVELVHIAAGAGGTAKLIDGVISTRRGNASDWVDLLGKAPMGEWELVLPDEAHVRRLFADEKLADILLVITYQGESPPWPAS